MDRIAKEILRIDDACSRLKAQIASAKAAKKRFEVELFKTMLKLNTEKFSVKTMKNGQEVTKEFNREKLRPKEHTTRKKKAEVEEDIALVLEGYGINRPRDVAKEIETARKAKGDDRAVFNREIQRGDVVYLSDDQD